MPSVLNRREAITMLVLAIIFIASFGIFIYWFQEKNTIEVPASGGTHIEGIVGGPSAINPIYASNSDTDRTLVEFVFSGLYKYDRGGAISLDIAASPPEVKENGTVYEVVLKDNVYWHDGKHLTADDVIFTVKAMQDPEYKSSLRANWLGVSIEKISDYGVRFRLKNAYPDFPERLTFKIIPQHIWAGVSAAQFPLSPYNFKPIGTGPYQLKSVNDSIKYDSRGRISSIKLTAFSKYHLQKPYIKNLVFKFYENDKQVIQAANSQQITGFVNRSNAQFSNGSFANYRFSMPRYFAVFFNTKGENKDLQSKEFRQALNYATDKEQIVKEILGNQATVVNSPLMPEIYGLAEPAIKYNLDLEQAQKLITKLGYTQKDGKWYKPEKNDEYKFTQTLKQGSMGEEVKRLQKCLTSLNTASEKIYPEEKISGIFDTATKNAVNRLQEKYRSELLDPDGIKSPTGAVKARTRAKLMELCAPPPKDPQPLKVAIATIEDENLKKVAYKIQEQWGKIGVEVEVIVYSLTDLRQTVLVNRSYDALLFGEVLGSIPDPFPFWHSTQAEDPGLNLSVYKNDDVDRLLEKARQDADMSTRNAKYEELQNLILTDAPAVFLYNPYNTYIASKDIKGIQEGNIVDIPKIYSDFNSWHINTTRAWKTK